MTGRPARALCVLEPRTPPALSPGLALGFLTPCDPAPRSHPEGLSTSAAGPAPAEASLLSAWVWDDALGGSRVLFGDIHPQAKHDPESLGVLPACHSCQLKRVICLFLFWFCFAVLKRKRESKTFQDRVDKNKVVIQLWY